MRKIWLSLTALVTAIALAVAFVAAPAFADGGTPCTRKVFKTALIKQACANGGRLAAKAAMHDFLQKHKVPACTECHAKLMPNYELKDTGFKRFQELGGK